MTLALLPANPFRWTLRWRTDVRQAWDGTEQREATIADARESFGGSFYLPDAAYATIRQLLSADPAGAFELPLVPEIVASVNAITSTTIAIDPTYAEWNVVGRRVLVVGPSGHGYKTAITVVAGGGATLTVGDSPPVGEVYPAGTTMIWPLEGVLLRDGQALGRYAVNAGRWSYVGDAAEVRAIAGTGATVATFDGYQVLDRRPLGAEASEQVIGGVGFEDAGGAVSSSTGWLRSQIVRGGASWLIRSPSDRQWWKAFLLERRGCWSPFLYPTWRPDLTVHTQPTGATALLRVVEDYSGEWFPSLAHRRLQVEYADGSLAYFAVASVTTGAGYDELTLTMPFPGALPGSSIVKVSFLETARLAADEATIEYGPGWIGRIALAAVVTHTAQEVVELPAAFPWTPTFDIVRSADGVYDATIDIAARMITPGTTRYLSTTGSDAADGLSWATAKRSMASVVASLSATAVAIYVAAGDYRGALGGWGGGVPYLYQHANIIAVGGRARFSISPSGLTWAPNVTYPSVYQVTTTAPYAVIDEASVDADGVPLYLTSRASVALVDANPGSYYASGGVLYVRTVDSRAPDASIHSFVAGVTNGFALNNVNVYVQDCDFIGGNRSWFSSDCLAFTAVRCGFYFGELDCYRSQSTADGVLVDCVTHAAWSGDGCSYDANGNHLELRHTAIRNGNGTVGTCNGSSAHGATMIRLSGYYANSDGPNAADVVDSRGFNAGLEMERNRATSTSQQVNYAVDGFATSATGWLLDCTLGGQVDGIAHDLRPIDAPDRIYVRETAYSGVSGSGLVLTF